MKIALCNIFSLLFILHVHSQTITEVPWNSTVYSETRTPLPPGYYNVTASWTTRNDSSTPSYWNGLWTVPTNGTSTPLPNVTKPITVNMYDGCRTAQLCCTGTICRVRVYQTNSSSYSTCFCDEYCVRSGDCCSDYNKYCTFSTNTTTFLANNSWTTKSIGQDISSAPPYWNVTANQIVTTFLPVAINTTGKLTDSLWKTTKYAYSNGSSTSNYWHGSWTSSSVNVTVPDPSWKATKLSYANGNSTTTDWHVSSTHTSVNVTPPNAFTTVAANSTVNINFTVGCRHVQRCCLGRNDYCSVQACMCDEYCVNARDCCSDYNDYCVSGNVTWITSTPRSLLNTTTNTWPHQTSTGPTVVDEKSAVQYISCQSAYIHVVVNMSRLPENVNWTTLTLADTACRGNSYTSYNHRMVQFFFPGDGCLTQKEETKDSIIYRNEVSNHESATGLINRRHKIKLPFRCIMSRKSGALKSFIPNDKQQFEALRVAYGNFSMGMDFYENSYNYSNVIQSFPYFVNLDKPILVRFWLLYSGDRYLKISPTDCWATPEGDGEDTVTYPLITNRCPNDSTIKIYPSTKNEFRFGLNSFEFINHPKVYIHCEAFVCNASDESTRCQRGCAKRFKRELATDTDGLLYLTQGPLVLRSRRTAEGSLQLDMKDNIPLSTSTTTAILIIGAACIVALVAVIAILVMKLKKRKQCFDPRCQHGPVNSI